MAGVNEAYFCEINFCCVIYVKSLALAFTLNDPRQNKEEKW